MTVIIMITAIMIIVIIKAMFIVECDSEVFIELKGVVVIVVGVVVEVVVVNVDINVSGCTIQLQ